MSVSVMQQGRFALRRLRRAPWFTAAAVVSLALGIGGATAVFSLIERVLLRPLPFPDADRLVALSHTLVIPAAITVEQSDASFLQYRRGSHAFSDVGAYQRTAVNVGPDDGAVAGDASRAARLAAARVSASIFRVLGVAALRGRVFLESEDGPGAPPVVIVSEQLWRRRLGADPAVVGRRLEVDGVPHEIVGVMPRSFRFPAPATQLWVPTRLDPAHIESATFDLNGIARLRPGVTPEAAASDLQALLLDLPEAFPGRLTVAAINATKMRAVVRPLREVVVGDIGRALWPLLGATALLLLLACANVANLFTVRATARQHETAVRRALGAGPGAIAMDFLAEGFLLAAAGGLLGLAVAAAGVGLLRSLENGISIPRLDEAGLDGTVLTLAAGLTVLATLLISLLPAVRPGGGAVLAGGMDAGRAAAPGRGTQRALRGLVVVQVALALTLVSAASLMARSFARLVAVRPGFDAAGVATFRVALPPASYPAPGDAARLIDGALGRLASVPGVEAAAAISKVPLDDEARMDTAVFLEDRPLAMGGIPGIHQIDYATPGLFAALGIPLLAGRSFEPLDPSRAPLEAVVTRSFARRYWPDGGALGRRMRFTPVGPWFTIVGVTGDLTATRLDGGPDEMVFLPFVTAPGPAEQGGGESAARFTPRNVAFVLRTRAGAAAALEPVRRAMREVAPGTPLYRTLGMSEILADAAARTRFTTRLLGIASLVALLLGALGFHGVLSYAVSLRARELAIHLALGAQPSDVRGLVTRQAAGLAAAGILAGLAVTISVTRFMAGLLFGVAPTDPMALATAVLVIAGVAALASWLPARRAAAVDPAQAFRTI